MLSSPVPLAPTTHFDLHANPAVVDVLIGREAVQCSSAAALTFLVWDILITFDEEVNFIWPITTNASKPWNLIKYLYLFTRYIPFMIEISMLFVGTGISESLHYTIHDCYIWQIFQGVAYLVVVGAVDIILILRVIALYHGNMALRVILLALYLLQLGGMGIGLSLAIPGIRYDGTCLVTGMPHSLLLSGATAMTFQVILFVLTVAKFIDALRSGWGDVPLILLLIRDGTWAFILLMGVYVGQACLFALRNHALSGLLYGWLLTALSFSGYRILLNLNHVSPHERQSSDLHRTNTDIQFTTQISSNDSDTSFSLPSLTASPRASRARSS